MRLLYILLGIIFIGCNSDKNLEGLRFIINENSAIIIEVDNVKTYKNNLKNNKFKKILTETSYQEQLDFFSAINKKKENSKINKDKLLSSLSISGASSYEWVNSFYYDKKLNKKLLSKFYKYQNVNIYSIFYGDKEYYLFYTGDIAVFSKNKILIEDVVRYYNNKENLYLKDLELKKVLETSLKNRDLFVLVDTKVLNRIINIELFSFYDIGKICKWITLDISIKNDKVIISGFLDNGKEENKYSRVILNQNYRASKIDKYLPKNTAYYIYKSISNIDTYKDDYNYYLELNNEKGYSTKTNMDKKEYIKIFDLKNIFDGEMILLQQGKKKSSKSIKNEKSLLLKIKNKTNLKKVLSAYNTNFIDKYKGYKINKINEKLDFKETFGNISREIKSPYYTIYENVLIFSNKYINIKEIISGNINKTNLGNNNSYNDFINNFGSNNIFVFASNPLWLNTMNAQVFKSSLRNSIKKNKSEFNKIKFVGVGLSAKSKGIFLSGILQYEDEKKVGIKAKDSWSTEVKYNVRNAICVLKNHRTNKLDYFYQDDKNYINLINHKGNIIWSKKIEGKIIGVPNQIDFYNNGKYQIIFATKDKIHLIDILGRNVEGYPIKTKKEITQPLNVFDYDNNKKYRLCMVCNKEIFMLDKKGKKIKGFSFEGNFKISTEIKHIRVKSKDYLYFIQNNGHLRILNRKGGDRIKYEGNYSINNNDLYFIQSNSNYFEAMNSFGKK